MDNLASRIYDARDNLQALHPDQEYLVAKLGSDMLSVSREAGIMDTMAQQQYTFGPRWNVLSGPANDLQAAIGILAR